ncbi:MAG: phage portal protein, partial [Clostridia bacterium]|nr:phage portal protein [Clostridia bacterium]
DSIVSELIVRVSQVSKVLDKFSSPAMTGPESALTYNDMLQRWELKMAEYYVRNNDTDPTPQFLTWDANMDANFKQIEFLVNQLYTISEMGSAVFGDLSHSAGNAASGTALRRLMMSPLAKARRIANSYDRVIKQIISACASIYGASIEPSEIGIVWNDGLPSDPTEEANVMNIRTGGKATISRWSAIRQLDGLSDSDTDAEIEMIEADETAETMGTAPQLGVRSEESGVENEESGMRNEEL